MGISHRLLFLTKVFCHCDQNQFVAFWKLRITVNKTVIKQLFVNLTYQVFGYVYYKYFPWWSMFESFIRNVFVYWLSHNLKTFSDISVLSTHLFADVLNSLGLKNSFTLLQSLVQNLSYLCGCVLWENQSFVTESWSYFERKTLRQVNCIWDTNDCQAGFLISDPFYNCVDNLLFLRSKIIHLVNN